MTTAELVLAIANVVQTIALAWILAWQQRAAYLVRKLNGDVVQELHAFGAELHELQGGRPGTGAQLQR